MATDMRQEIPWKPGIQYDLHEMSNGSSEERDGAVAIGRKLDSDVRDYNRSPITRRDVGIRRGIKKNNSICSTGDSS
jgi:hypothetical protein